MINQEILELLSNKRNLLAFSAGVDSSALFYILREFNIPFDIAFVNYGLREQSIQEEKYTEKLASKYNIRSFIINAPKWENNFEANARGFRYKFFQKIIEEYNYQTLITAHQLNDQLEWFLMRLTKGAGVAELLGLKDISIRYTAKEVKYSLIRPILDIGKDELINYLEKNNHKYFIDATNLEDKYERNLFRNNFSDKLLLNYKKGISRSFKYLKEEKELLSKGIKIIYSFKELRVISIELSHQKVRAVDITLKKLGYLLSSNQRKEIKNKDSIVIGGEWAIVYQNNKLYISPFINIKMPKKYKELCRVSSMPIKIRPYCYSHNIKPIEVMFM